LLLALYPATSAATYPGANGLVAYDGTAASSYEIFTVSPQGRDTTQLTNNLADDSGTSWSANGRKIAFARRDVQAGWDIWTMWADGTHQRQVTQTPGDEWAPYFGPGGHRIVMATDHAISTVRTDGTGRRQLRRGFLSQPEYSPNGKRVVFSGLPNSKNESGIWTIRRDGSHLRRVTRSPQDEDGYDASPDWRPDGRRIVYARCTSSSEWGCGDGGIYSVRPDGSGNHLILSASSVPPPVYSPSGRRIALHHLVVDYPDYREVRSLCADIFSNSASGSDPSDWDHRRLLTHNCEQLEENEVGEFAVNPSWQPIPQP
jgi:Tol biopolymer transport system component